MNDKKKPADERSQIEDGLLQASKNWQATFDAISDFVILMKPDHEIVEINKAALDAIGKKREEVVGQKCFRTIHQTDAPIPECPCVKCSETKISVVSEYTQNSQTFEMVAWPIFDDDNRIRAYAHIVKNITARKLAEKTIESHNEMLAAINGLSTELASLGPEEPLQKFAARKLMEMTGAGLVASSEYLPAEKELKISELRLPPGFLEKATRLLGLNPHLIRSPVTGEMYQEIIATRIGKRKTISEVTFGQIPPLIGSAIEKLLGIDHFIGIAYVIDGKLYGTSVLGIRNAAPEPSSELLESFAHIIGISLRRQKSEKALHESEERHHALLENMKEGYQTIGPDWRYRYVNKSAARHGKQTPSTMIGRTMMDTYPGIEQSEMYARLRECMENRVPHSMENQFVYPDRSFAWFELSIQPVSDGISIVSIDITARKQAEESLKESESLYHSLFENMLNGFAYCKMVFENDRPVDFVYLDVNHAFGHLTGLKNVAGRKVSEVIPGIRESDPGLLERYGRVARSGKPEMFEIFVASMKMWFAVSVYCPKADHFVVVFDVITERKQAEEQIKKQVDELQRWQDAMVGRENRVVEVKKEVNELLIQLGKPVRYPSAAVEIGK